MSSAVPQPADRNVDGILHYMHDYLEAREAQVVRTNPKTANVIHDIAWLHLEILRNVLQKSKAFGGEKYRVADVLAGGDESKRKALLSPSDQNSLLDELIDRTDDAKKNADHGIHDMRTLFRAIEPSLESLVNLIQHWMKWDIGDASDLHHFDEQVRRLAALKQIQISDDLRHRYRPAVGKAVDSDVTDADILNLELKRLELVTARFSARRGEDEAYQMIIKREAQMPGDDDEGAPYNYKKRQADELRQRFESEKESMAIRLQANNPAASPEATQPPAEGDTIRI